jgi:hypothetical protein
MSNDSTADAEELLQQSKEQSRHTSEPTATDSEGEGVDRVTAIKDALVAIDAGDAPENINLRDARLKALLVGLGEADELSSAASDAAEVLDGDPDIDLEDASQSDVARLLLRIGLQEALPEVLEDAKEARKQKALEQADGF